MTHLRGPKGKRARNQLHQRFETNRPCQKLVSDVSEFKLLQTQEKVYIEPIMDLYNREILSYTITVGSPNLEFAMKPLEQLLPQLPTKQGYQMTMHTDQGWQYRHHNWQHLLKKAHIRQSMSCKGRCRDNACIESFFNKLKVEVGNLKQFSSAKELMTRIQAWIVYYNYSRVQMKLGGLSPISYRQKAA